MYRLRAVTSFELVSMDPFPYFSREICQQCATVKRNSHETLRDPRWRPPTTTKQTSLLGHKTFLFMSHLSSPADFPVFSPNPDHVLNLDHLERRVFSQNLRHERGREKSRSQLHSEQQKTPTEFHLRLRYTTIHICFTTVLFRG